MKKVILVFLLILLGISLTKDVYAYVDPGIGGTVYQIIILIFWGIGFLFFSLKRKLFNIFHKKKGRRGIR